MEALPENVDGHKVESHRFEHQVQHSVNWGYVALAAVGLALIWKLGLLTAGEPNNEDESEYTQR
jgi:hypothetical protein